VSPQLTFSHFFNQRHHRRVERSMHQNVHYIIMGKIKLLFQLSSELYILCTNAIKRYYATFTIQVLPVFCCTGVHESKKTCYRVVRTSVYIVYFVVYFLHWRALQHKFYRQQIRDVDHLKCVPLHCWIRKTTTQ